VGTMLYHDVAGKDESISIHFKSGSGAVPISGRILCTGKSENTSEAQLGGGTENSISAYYCVKFIE
jgi:hypothetical protein